MMTGKGTSGSTAWNNSVRSRLYFASGKKNDNDLETCPRAQGHEGKLWA